MDVWSPETAKLLVPVPWSHHPSADHPTLLLKLCVVERPAGPHLLCLVTNLESCYFEALSPRQLTRRFTDAYIDSQDQDTQSQYTAFSQDDGAEQLTAHAHDLVDAVRAGRAQVRLDNAAFEVILTVALPTFSFKFLGDALDTAAPACIAQHLLTPLLGLSASLLSLVPDSAFDDGSLALAVDTSARSERAKEGRACKLFFEAGGSVLARWMARFNAVKEKDVPSISPRFSRSISPSTLAAMPPALPRRSSSARPPSPSKKTVAQQMLDHRNAATSSPGAKVGWEDSQDVLVPRHEPSAIVRKGKAKPVVSEDPQEEDESFPPPPAQQPTSKRLASRSPSPLTPPLLATGDDSDPPTDQEDAEAFPSTRSLPSQSQSQSPQPPPPPLPAPPLALKPPPPLNAEAERQARKDAERNEELAARARTIELARKAAEAKAKATSASVKKKKKKL